MAKKVVIRGMVVIFIGAAVLISLAIFKPSAIIKPLKMLKRHISFLDSGREITYTKKKIDFSIGILVGKDPFHLTETQAIANPVITAEDIDDVDASFVADPFMIHEKNTWYMFFEVMNKTSKNGDIGVATSMDGIKWTYQQIVLDEPFHLSYPHVFSHENSYYMIPETSVEKELRLYKSTDFPADWRYEATLLSGLEFADSTIFQYGGKWYIFSETDPVGFGELRLYYADNLLGPWVEHPSSPIISGDENIARPAGKVLFYQDKLFRVAQDDWPTYGNDVRIFQIDVLTATDYAEHELCDLPELQAEAVPVGLKTPAWRLDGFHQLDLHQLGEDEWIACIDGASRQSISRQLVIKFRVPFTKEKIISGRWARPQ
ncbi:hypothetical protein [uncultured Desulfosarcina sp.]|uniref:glucosamine inositolphosphorylceramide transferase family protein n=1 Tax=uncultured Desulfosarcina sp. TaxID=218289 RepID=UPI0029C6E194|nr:hypothetical protein [uncultured Desulfosarcina sp.]